MKLTRQFLPILFIASVALLAVMAFATDGVEGRTITVDDDGGADYERIQDAIDSSEDGDTVRVWEGVYEENVVVNRSINFVGNGSEVTTIDGGGSSNVVWIMADWVNMSGFDISNGKNGIFLYRSDDCKITNNTCSAKNENGIYLQDSSDCTIKNNKCSNNDHGIYLWDSSDCTIENNTYENNSGYGIVLGSSSECTITNNICSKNDYGISLRYSSNLTITNNTMKDNGIYIFGNLEYWNSHTIKPTNTVNGKPVYYYKNVTGLTVPYGAGQVILANCTWINVENQNCSNSSVGILVGYSSDIALENNKCSSNHYGINLWHSSNCTIANNTCSSNNKYGIFLQLSDDCGISNNTCSAKNEYGIFLDSSSVSTITNNTCENNNGGISLVSSNDCKITNNTCDNNFYGIILIDSYSCTITKNTCDNNDDGIFLDRSSECTITKNTISENGGGISLIFSSRANTAHYNIIYNNTEYGIYVSDSCEYAIDARYNRWGAASGPYHPTENPEGTGDNVTDSVEFGPWLKEPAGSYNEKPADEENETDINQQLCLSSLLIILVSLFVLLIIMVYLPGNHFTQNGKSSITDENTDESSSLPDMINTCPHCGGKFEVESTKRPIQFNCNFCGEKVEFK